jgi:hypothetical protein
MRSYIFTLAMFCATVGAANASQIAAAGGLSAGPRQTHAVCYLFNPGPSAVVVSTLKILDPFNISQQLTHDECNARTLQVGQTCGSVANVFNDSEYSCSASVSGAKGQLRGGFELRDANEDTLASQDIR